MHSHGPLDKVPKYDLSYLEKHTVTKHKYSFLETPKKEDMWNKQWQKNKHICDNNHTNKEALQHWNRLGTVS